MFSKMTGTVFCCTGPSPPFRRLRFVTWVNQWQSRHRMTHKKMKQNTQSHEVNKLTKKACKLKTKPYIRLVKREDYLDLIREIEGEVLAVKRLAAQVGSQSQREDILSAARVIVE